MNHHKKAVHPEARSASIIGIHLIDDLAQVLEPLISTPPRADIVVDHTVEDNSWADMDPDETGNPDGNLEVVGHLVSAIQTAIVTGLLGDGQQFVQLVLTHARAVRPELGKTLVSGIPGLVDDIHVKVRLLVVEERLAESPKLGRGELIHGKCSFVNQR